eukprot:CAMPEP_0170803632 /NCGR_PEP_ID=MMETSP0733-20121128/30179_1 /TAXON_ID=186038 /ORGANISM="Fragilariopsis kerguelensis, Strain L26-C5" /LENGTH=224 /DNA_ID=CAMNT_0011157437 /DNA_START=83 /DNA_END=760 /DNA_ORIENTATION=+
MVQGNSARRKELAAGRRQDRKDEIERKKAGAARVTPAEARARLLDFGTKNSTKSSMIAWSVSPSSSSVSCWCAAYFRDGACPRGKRCKWSHAESIAHLACPLAVFAETLPALVRGPLEAVQAGGKLVYNSKIRTQRREKSALYFVEYNNTLVFDAENPHCFEQWASDVAMQKRPEEEEEDNMADNVTVGNGSGDPDTEIHRRPAPLSKKERRKMKKESTKNKPP